MMIISQETLPKYFSIADSTTSWFTQPTNTFDFVGNNSKILLVTVGDSWTWGSDLSPNNHNNQHRRDNVYGHVLAKSMSADWLNLALSAQGNFWIADMVEQLSKIITSLEYEKIYIVCTFTGVLRWFNTHFDKDINYIDWFKNNIDKKEDFDKLLAFLNSVCVNKILRSLSPYNHVILKVANNFVNPIGFEQLLTDQQVPMAWFQVLGCDDGQKIYTCTYYERISQAMKFIDSKHRLIFKQWLIEKVDQSGQRLAALQDSKKFCNGHPLTDGHRLWANYLLNHV